MFTSVHNVWDLILLGVTAVLVFLITFRVESLQVRIQKGKIRKSLEEQGQKIFPLNGCK